MINDQAAVFDLPADGRCAEGDRATVVSGVVTFENRDATGEMPGKLVRGSQHANA
jgi:N-acyl-D-amino-acid deacylase